MKQSRQAGYRYGQHVNKGPHFAHMGSISTKNRFDVYLTLGMTCSGVGNVEVSGSNAKLRKQRSVTNLNCNSSLSLETHSAGHI